MDAGLFAVWRRLSAGGLNNRAIAAKLAMSEAQLVACGTGTVSRPLAADANRLLAAAIQLGPVKWVVRNDDAVLEKPGTLQQVTVSGDAVVARSESFELELSRAATASAFALAEQTSRGTKRSVQLFDASGATLIKIVLRPESSVDAFERFVETLKSDGSIAAGARSPQATQMPRSLVPGRLAAFLQEAARLSVPLRFVVQNAGARIDTTTRIHRVKRSDRAPWINVLDPELDLHLHEQALTGIACESRWLHWYGACDRPALSVECTDSFTALARSVSGLPASPAAV
jgi:putative hemin transport protein